MPAGSLSGARTRSRPRPGPRARCRWWSVTAVPHAATPTVSPAPAWVTARASHGPSTRTTVVVCCGSASLRGMCWVPNSSRALVVQGAGGGVEVLGGVGVPGGVPGGEPDDPVLVVDREGDPGPEPVDQPPVPGGDRDPGGQQVGVGVPAGAQVVDQPGPRRRGVPDPVPGGFGGGVPAGGDRLGEHDLRGLGLEPGLRVEQDHPQPVAVRVQGRGQPVAGRIRGRRGRLGGGRLGVGGGGEFGGHVRVGCGGWVGGRDQGPGGVQDPAGGAGDRLVVPPGPAGDVGEGVVGWCPGRGGRRPGRPRTRLRPRSGPGTLGPHRGPGGHAAAHARLRGPGS